MKSTQKTRLQTCVSPVFGLAGFLLIGSANAESSFFSSPLLQLSPTNEVKVIQAAPEPIQRLATLSTNDPAIKSLGALEELAAQTNQNWKLPTTESIGGLDVPEEFENDDIDVIVERVKVKDIIKEAEELVEGEETRHKAIMHLESALEIVRHNESKFEIYGQIGVHHYSDRNFNEAADAMEKALEHKPGDPALIGNLSAIYLFLNRVDDALATLGKISTNMLVADRNMNYLFLVNFNYACAYSMKKQNQESLAHLEMAARYDPINTLTSIGDVQLDNVRKTQPFKDLKKKLELLIEARERRR